jgi:small-conductance mechanosensitive channel
MRPAATAAIVGLFMVTLAGCEDDNPVQSRAEINRLRAEGEALKKTNLALRDSVRNLEAAKAALDEMARRSRDENEQLKGQLADTRQLMDKQNAQMASLRQQVSDLLARAASAPAPGAPPIDRSGAAAGLGPAPPPAPPKPRDELAIADAKKEQADLEAQIAQLEPRVNLGRSKIMSLSRATMDVRLIPPDGHGEEWFLWHPSVRPGDFRSQHDKEMAINAAKEELLPLETDLKALKDEQEKVMKRLAELMAPIK